MTALDSRNEPSLEKNLIETVVSTLSNPSIDCRNLIAGLALLAVLSTLSLLHENAEQVQVQAESTLAQSEAPPQSAAMQSAISAVSKLLSGRTKPAPDPAMLSSVLPMLGQILSQRTQQPTEQADQPKQ